MRELNPLNIFWLWLVNDSSIYTNLTEDEKRNIDPFRFVVFLMLHLSCIAVFFVEFSWVALIFCLLLYVARMFFITAFYHRYFSHKTFKTSRTMQFLMGFLGCTAAQRGPLWWAGHHRQHHIKSDTKTDPHSPKNGFINSHMLWFLRRGNFPMIESRVKDLTKYKELLILEKFDWVPFLLLLVFCYGTGELLFFYLPELNTSGIQFLLWGGLISTVILYHATYTINSLAHLIGKRRFNTNDDSRNNLVLALITLGEGWHNNHHRYPVSTRQGFYKSEIDISYLLLKLLAMFGLVSDFKPVPVNVLEEGRYK